MGIFVQSVFAVLLAAVFAASPAAAERRPYWSECAESRIRRSNLDGSGAEGTATAIYGSAEDACFDRYGGRLPLWHEMRQAQRQITVLPLPAVLFGMLS